MGDDDQRLAAGRQVLRQPGDALDVEVVGGLVEHQQVVLADQRRASATRRRSPPDSGPTTRSSMRRGPARSPNSPVSTSRTRGVAGPLVRRPVADDQRAHRRRRVEVVALGDAADPQAAGVGDPAGVGRLAPGQQPQQGGLAVAVAADDADPVALADAERDVVEQGAGAVRLADALQVDEVARHSAVPDQRGHRRPGRAPRRTERQVPGGAQRDRDVDGVLRAAGEEHDGRPGAGDQRAERAGLRAGLERLRAAPAAASRPPPAGRCAARRPARRRRRRAARPAARRPPAARAPGRPSRSRSHSA